MTINSCLLATLMFLVGIFVGHYKSEQSESLGHIAGNTFYKIQVFDPKIKHAELHVVINGLTRKWIVDTP